MLGSSPILSRLFAPEDFGVAALLASLAVVPIVLCTGQYYLGIGLEKRQADAMSLVVLSLLLALVTSAAMVPVVLGLATQPVFIQSSIGAVADYLWLIPAFMLIESTLYVLRFWEVRFARYGSIVRNRLTESLVMAGAQITFGVIGLGPIGLIAGRWLAFFVASVDASISIVRRLNSRLFRVLRVRKLKRCAVEHWRFPIYQAPATSVSEFGRQGAPILFGVFYSPVTVGLYWFSDRVLQRPSMLLGSNVGRVFYQKAADIRIGDRRIFPAYWKATGGLAALCIVPFGVIVVFGPELFSWIFGAEWYRAGQFAQWMTLSSFAHVIHFPARSCTALFNLQRLFAIVETCRLIASAFAIVAVAYLGGDDLTAVAAFSATQLLITLLFVVSVGVRLHQADRLQTGRSQLKPTASVPPL
ncbi:MAG: oligosaccharide flippase family protein [Hyphomicrobiales bacterium]|nr:oligosaccharide flippase family protein [Hyphomicrobiales bacterium]